MVTVATIKDFDVQIDQRVERNGAHELFDEREIECPADVGDAFRAAIFEKRATAEINDDPRQRLIHWQIGHAIAVDAPLFAESLFNCLAKNDSCVFHRVVKIHFDVAINRYIQVDFAVFRKKRQHVIKKRHAGIDRRLAGAIEIEVETDLGFCGVSFNRGGSIGTGFCG